MIRRHPNGWQFYPLGRRQHHGLTGLELIVLGVALVALGSALCWHDRHDARVWLIDFLRHPAWNGREF